MFKMETNLPARKVVGSSLAVAISTILIYVLKAYGNVSLPPGLEPAIVTVVTFLVGYYIPPAARDGIKDRTGQT